MKDPMELVVRGYTRMESLSEAELMRLTHDVLSPAEIRTRHCTQLKQGEKLVERLEV